MAHRTTCSLNSCLIDGSPRCCFLPNAMASLYYSILYKAQGRQFAQHLLPTLSGRQIIPIVQSQLTLNLIKIFFPSSCAWRPRTPFPFQAGASRKDVWKAQKRAYCTMAPAPPPTQLAPKMGVREKTAFKCKQFPWAAPLSCNSTFEIFIEPHMVNRFAITVTILFQRLGPMKWPLVSVSIVSSWPPSVFHFPPAIVTSMPVLQGRRWEEFFRTSVPNCHRHSGILLLPPSATTTSHQISSHTKTATVSHSSLYYVPHCFLYLVLRTKYVLALQNEWTVLLL